MLEADVGGAAMAAIETGDIENLVNTVEHAVIESSTADAGDVQVELETPVKFYNELSAVHTKLTAQIDDVHIKASTIAGQKAGGSVAGTGAPALSAPPAGTPVSQTHTGA